MTTNPRGGHEPGDIAPKRVVQASLGVLALIVFTMVAMWLLLGGLERWQTAARPPAHKLAGTRGERLPPEPRLQENPLADLATLRAREDRQLDGYGWVDRKAGRARIPIARAMELLAEERR
jgi:hypothetical protein